MLLQARHSLRIIGLEALLARINGARVRQDWQTANALQKGVRRPMQVDQQEDLRKPNLVAAALRPRASAQFLWGEAHPQRKQSTGVLMPAEAETPSPCALAKAQAAPSACRRASARACAVRRRISVVRSFERRSRSSAIRRHASRSWTYRRYASLAKRNGAIDGESMYGKPEH